MASPSPGSDKALVASAQWLFAVFAAVFVARRGLKKGSLSRSGAIAAFVLGAITLGASFLTGAVLLAFYFSGSSFTKWKSAAKSKLDLEWRKGGGERTWQQVFATAGFGAALCLLWALRFGWTGPQAEASAEGEAWLFSFLDCSRLSSVISLLFEKASPSSDPAFAGLVIILYVASFATVCGDTWASELGVLSTKAPILLTDLLFRCRLRRVPRGTNGGVSGWGTLVSALGGLFIGFVAWLCTAAKPALVCAGFLQQPSSTATATATASALDSAPQACRLAFGLAPFGVSLSWPANGGQPSSAASGAGFFSSLLFGASRTEESSTVTVTTAMPLLWLLPLGLFAGFVGSMVDSIFGALVQRSWVQVATGKATSRLPSTSSSYGQGEGEGGSIIIVPPSLFDENAIAELAQKAFAAARQAEKEGLSPKDAIADEGPNEGEEEAAKLKPAEDLAAPESSGSSRSNSSSTLRQRRGIESDLVIKPPSPDEDEDESAAETSKTVSSTDLQTPSSVGEPASASLSPSAQEALKTVKLGKRADPRLFAVISGYDLVSNEAVNFLSSSVAAGLTYAVCWLAHFRLSSSSYSR